MRGGAQSPTPTRGDDGRLYTAAGAPAGAGPAPDGSGRLLLELVVDDRGARAELVDALVEGFPRVLGEGLSAVQLRGADLGRRDSRGASRRRRETLACRTASTLLAWILSRSPQICLRRRGREERGARSAARHGPDLAERVEALLVVGHVQRLKPNDPSFEACERGQPRRRWARAPERRLPSISAVKLSNVFSAPVLSTENCLPRDAIVFGRGARAVGRGARRKGIMPAEG